MTSKLTITDERIEKIAVWLDTESHSLNLEMLTCLRELQERRKADSEPVAWMHNNNNIGIPAITTSPKIGQYWMTEFKDVQPLYRHAQQSAPETEREPIAWLNDAYLARGVVDGEAGSEDAGPGYIPVYREASPAQPAPVVQCPFPCGWDNLNKLAIQNAAFVTLALVADEPATESVRQAVISNNDLLLKVISACRAAMLQAGYTVRDLSTPVDQQVAEYEQNVLQAGNSPVIPGSSKEALSEAVAAIYFTDSSDYLPALYSVVKALSPEVFAQLLSNEKAAFDATRLPAAPQEVPDGQR